MRISPSPQGEHPTHPPTHLCPLSPRASALAAVTPQAHAWTNIRPTHPPVSPEPSCIRHRRSHPTGEHPTHPPVSLEPSCIRHRRSASRPRV